MKALSVFTLLSVFCSFVFIHSSEARRLRRNTRAPAATDFVKLTVCTYYSPWGDPIPVASDEECFEILEGLGEGYHSCGYNGFPFPTEVDVPSASGECSAAEARLLAYNSCNLSLFENVETRGCRATVTCRNGIMNVDSENFECYL